MSHWKSAIVRVWDGLPHENGRFAGTAFFIDDKTLLTAKHVIEGCAGTIYLGGMLDGADEKIDRDNNIYYDEKRDVAILKTNRVFSDTTSLRLSSQAVQEDQDVLLAGFFDKSQAIHTVSSRIAGHVGVQHTWRVQESVSQGMSGGPVLSPDGQVLGLLQARDANKNIAYLIPTNAIENTLAQFTTIRPLAPLFNIRALPAHYLERNEHLDQIRALLLQTPERNVGITGISRAVGLQGMGGIGKSLLAAAIAHDSQIRAAFPDGVVWVSLGQSPDIIALQYQLIEHFDEIESTPDNPDHGQLLLQQILMGKRVLLILDDVWQPKHAAYFNVVTPTKRLITTRHAQVIVGTSAKEHRIDLLSPQQALHLLRIQSKWQEILLPEEAVSIIDECGSLPLAVSMVGAMLQGKPRKRPLCQYR